jgi:hypothetical protein
MIRDEYLRRLTDAAHVELYLSAGDGARIYWPWRMEPPKEACQSYRNACERYVIDSDPQDDDVTAEDVLDTAFRLDAEVASLADVYQNKPATVDSLLRGLDVADDHPFDGTLLLPLQAPYAECWREIGEPTDEWIGIGGLKDAPDSARIRAAREIRQAVGDGAHVHGFGWGPTDELARAIRREPSLLDSLDYSTPVRSIPIDVTPGKERKSVTAAYAGARLVSDLREVSPYADSGSPEELRDNDQQGLDEIGP